MNRSFKTIILGFALLTNFIQLEAQNKPIKQDRKEKEGKINALRISYYNDKLALSESEQKLFWPLFNEYQLKDKNLKDSFQKKYKKNEIVFMDDKKSEEFLNDLLKMKDDENALYRNYLNKFKKVLPIKKVAMLPMVEKEFKKEILEKAMHQKNGKPGKRIED